MIVRKHNPLLVTDHQSLGWNSANGVVATKVWAVATHPIASVASCCEAACPLPTVKISGQGIRLASVVMMVPWQFHARVERGNQQEGRA